MPKVDTNFNVKIIKTQLNTKDPIYTTNFGNYYQLVTIIRWFFALFTFFPYCIALFRTLAHFVALLLTKCKTSYFNLYTLHNHYL